MQRVVKLPSETSWHFHAPTFFPAATRTACGQVLPADVAETMLLGETQSAGSYCQACTRAVIREMQAKGWRQRIARRLAEALAWASRAVGQ